MFDKISKRGKNISIVFIKVTFWSFEIQLKAILWGKKTLIYKNQQNKPKRKKIMQISSCR